ncbi:MAG: hypothetical protein ACERKV_06085 [Clostridiaceae bacterium]
MGFRDKLSERYTRSYFKKYGDRITQAQGNVVSVKVEEKTILWIFHKLLVTIILRPDRSKNILKCVYQKHRWFKKISFIKISQGNLLLIQGLKGKKGKEKRETIEIMNIRNLSTKKDLVPMEGKAQSVKRVQRPQKYK